MNDRGTYFFTTRAQTPLFQTARTAELFIHHLQFHRVQSRFALHAFVVMPDHVHIILTPGQDLTLERCVQFIKGGFSFRIKPELGITREIWQPGYHDRRIRDARECANLFHYLEQNPVKRNLSVTAEIFDYSSANPRWHSFLDPLPDTIQPQPQRLKARSISS